jgi:hypothetical protein
MNIPPRDPFGERTGKLRRRRLTLLGARFTFESANASLMREIERVFAGLPAFKLTARAPAFRVRLVLRQRARGFRQEPPRPKQFAGLGFVYCGFDADNFALLAPGERRALVVVSSDLLSRRYHLRYELLEFVVLTLAARAQQLVPLHAGCVATGGRALLLLGESGSGKSTAALHASAAGLEYVAEDSLFVAPRSLRAAALTNYLHVPVDLPPELWPARSRRLFARAEVIRRRSGVRKYAIDLRRGGMRVARRAPRIVATVFLSARAARGDRLLTESTAGRAAARLRAGQPYAAHQPGWAAFARRLAKLPAYEMRRGANPAATVGALRTLLRELPR